MNLKAGLAPGFLFAPIFRRLTFDVKRFLNNGFMHVAGRLEKFAGNLVAWFVQFSL